jgi:hypothetical protein
VFRLINSSPSTAATAFDDCGPHLPENSACTAYRSHFEKIAKLNAFGDGRGLA